MWVSIDHLICTLSDMTSRASSSTASQLTTISEQLTSGLYEQAATAFGESSLKDTDQMLDILHMELQQNATKILEELGVPDILSGDTTRSWKLEAAFDGKVEGNTLYLQFYGEILMEERGTHHLQTLMVIQDYEFDDSEWTAAGPMWFDVEDFDHESEAEDREVEQEDQGGQQEGTDTAVVALSGSEAVSAESQLNRFRQAHSLAAPYIRARAEATSRTLTEPGSQISPGNRRSTDIELLRFATISRALSRGQKLTAFEVEGRDEADSHEF
jgi:hypothetical protein